MKRLLLMAIMLLSSLASYAINDGEILSDPKLVEEKPVRSLIIYPEAYITSGDLNVLVAQSTVDVRVFTESGTTPILTSSNYEKVVVDLDELEPGTYDLVIDANGRQFEATFVVFTIE